MDDLPRVVLDTGVVLQVVLRPSGPAGGVVALIDRGMFTLYLSGDVLAEYREVLRRPAVLAKHPNLTADLATAIVARMAGCGNMIASVAQHFRYARDPDDEPIVNLAIEASADYLVTRDADLLDLMADAEFRASFPAITILDPVAFLRELVQMPTAEP